MTYRNPVSALVTWCREHEYPLSHIAPSVPVNYYTLHYHASGRGGAGGKPSMAIDAGARRVLKLLRSRPVKALKLKSMPRTIRIRTIDKLVASHAARQ